MTDHDTVAGYRSIADAIPSGLRVIPSVEMSSKWHGVAIHILGLGVDVTDKALNHAIQLQQESRMDRAKEIAHKLHKVGLVDGWERASAGATRTWVGRPQFAQLLVDDGIVPNINAAFKKYLGPGKIGDIKQGWLDMETTINALRHAGALVSLAHPNRYRLTATKLRRLVADFKDLGGSGLEIVNGNQTNDTTMMLDKLATRHQLVATFGSDYHGPGQAWSELGKYAPLPSESYAQIVNERLNLT